MTALVWTEQQFDKMSWHDCPVHALRLVEGDYGAGQLILDLDYILDGERANEGFRFRIVPVHLAFQEVTALRIHLDYASCAAGLTPFQLHAIERRQEPRERHVAQLWRIAIGWPRGELSFEARGFTQRATGPVVVTDQQGLRPEQRPGAL